MLMIRPSLLVLVDELEAPEASTYQWLLHAFEQFEIDPDATTVISRRNGASLEGRLFCSNTLSLSQTNAWHVAPDKGYPTLEKELPEKRWHFTAEAERTDRCRIVAVFSVQGSGEDKPEFSVTELDRTLTIEAPDVTAQVSIDENATTVLTVSSEGESMDIQA